MQQQKDGFDHFELDNDEYDIYRMQKLKDNKEVPKEVKT
jgi:hypothetical protein